MSLDTEVVIGNQVMIHVDTFDMNGRICTPAAAPTYTVYDWDMSSVMSNGTGSGTLKITTSSTYATTFTVTSDDGYAVNKVYPAKWKWTTASSSLSTWTHFSVR